MLQPIFPRSGISPQGDFIAAGDFIRPNGRISLKKPTKVFSALEPVTLSVGGRPCRGDIISRTVKRSPGAFCLIFKVVAACPAAHFIATGKCSPGAFSLRQLTARAVLDAPPTALHNPGAIGLGAGCDAKQKTTRRGWFFVCDNSAD